MLRLLGQEQHLGAGMQRASEAATVQGSGERSCCVDVDVDVDVVAAAAETSLTSQRLRPVVLNPPHAATLYYI